MKTLIITIIFLLAVSAAVLAQDKMEIKDADSNLLMQVNDEGDAGSVSLPGLTGSETAAAGIHPVSELPESLQPGNEDSFCAAEVGPC